MDNLVFNNLKQRPARSLTTITGVALGVVLVLLVGGLARGMLREKGERESKVGAEIMLRPSGSLMESLSTSELQMPVEVASKVALLPGVRMVTPVAQYLERSNSGIGFRMVEGVNSTDYALMSEVKLVEGRIPENDKEVMVARSATSREQYHPGSVMTILDRQFTVSGVYWPESGARIKMRLEALQQIIGAANKASFILVKCEDPEKQTAMQQQIQRQFPEFYPVLTRDLPRYYAQGFPALNKFLHVVAGVAMVVSSLVILLAMYTTVTERTREIGILKSLGASRGMIILLIESEAITLALLGTVTGFLAAHAGRYVITHLTSLRALDIEPRWVLIAGLISLGSAFAGALYPALRAANQDPVEAISYE